MAAPLRSGALLRCNASIHREIPEGYASRTEGKATILQKGNEVFYNEAQVRRCHIALAAIHREQCWCRRLSMVLATI